MRQLLRNCVLVKGWGDDVISDAAILWDGDTIIASGSVEDVLPLAENADVHQAKGKLLLPGLVNAHHHFYSQMAKGLNPGMPIDGFPQTLDRLWWRLDRAHDAESVRLSARLAALESIKAGTTTVFDHHASPSIIDGSLDIIAEELDSAGLSAMLCYEVSDRNGHAEAKAGLAENLRFATKIRSNKRIKSIVGFHAGFTLSDKTLIGALGHPDDEAIHIHVAEDMVDVESSFRIHGVGPLERLKNIGLLSRNSLVIHGIHLPDEELEMIAESGAMLVHNPESNANNSVGRLDLRRAAALGCRIGLGTDGIGSDVLLSLKSAFLLARLMDGTPQAGWEVVPRLLQQNCKYSAELFKEPKRGTLQKGAPADFCLLDYKPTTEINKDNLFAHLVFGAAGKGVCDTVAAGKYLLKDHVAQTIDVEKLRDEAKLVSAALWKRFAKIPAGTPNIGDQ
jgi:putative selenium metabolism protein SsnA